MIGQIGGRGKETAVELQEERRIAAPRERVYAALNDPEILRQCIPGCETLTKTGDNQMEATVLIKIGPVKARFSGAVELKSLNPPESYTIAGEGKGGAAGFAKGHADVRLTADGAGTMLKYDVKADVGGKIAQLGSRLIDSTSRKMAGDFFAKFAELVEKSEAGGALDAAASLERPSAEPPEAATAGSMALYWVGAGVLVLIIFVVLASL
jgi:uncharacterized protein